MAAADSARGAQIPFAIDAGGSVTWATGTEKVRQNVRMILSIRLGERPMRRDFGTRIPSLAHEPNDDVLASLIESQAREALMRWEPRLTVIRSRIRRDDGLLTLWLDYVQIDDQTTGQVVVSPNA
jgi:phage baseplate assembly protein W